MEHKAILNNGRLQDNDVIFGLFFLKHKAVIRYCQLKMKINAVKMVDITTIE